MSQRPSLNGPRIDQATRHASIPDDGSIATLFGLTHPDDVVEDNSLTPAGKRAVLASWASDTRAVSNRPALRQLDNGAIVHIDDIMAALRALDGDGQRRKDSSGAAGAA